MRILLALLATIVVLAICGTIAYGCMIDTRRDERIRLACIDKANSEAGAIMCRDRRNT